MSRLKEEFNAKIRGQLQEQLGFQSVMQVPRLQKITLNMGVGEAIGDKKILDHAVANLSQITGQKPGGVQRAHFSGGLQGSRRLANWLQGYGPP